ncbi:hypothetical protein F5Y13DRAFT_108487 [Hypoxylon sp. FL1857]|nr:hypothetical protein F5Y13DRAFT_108487 [Hypoxylon sp. FL1857]
MGLSYQVKAVTAAACLWAFSAQASTTTTSAPNTSSSTTSTSISNTISSTSATSPSGTPSLSIPGVTSLPDLPIILSVVPVKDSVDDKGLLQQQVFIDATRPINPTSCTSATPFNLTAGRLSTSGGQYLSTDRDVLYKPLGTSSRTHAIASTFSIVDGLLRWYSDAFYRGRARYCQIPATGLVYVTFHIEKTWPQDCGEVDVAVHLASQCNGGEIGPGAPILPTGVVSTTDVAMAMGTGTGGVRGGAARTSAEGGWDEL